MTDLYAQAQQYAMQPYTIILTRDETTDGEPIFVAFNPELPGCLAQGETEAEVLTNLIDARTEYILGLLQHNLPVPSPNPVPTESGMKGRSTVSYAYAVVHSFSPEPKTIPQSLPESTSGGVSNSSKDIAFPVKSSDINLNEDPIAAVEWPS